VPLGPRHALRVLETRQRRVLRVLAGPRERVLLTTPSAPAPAPPLPPGPERAAERERDRDPQHTNTALTIAKCRGENASQVVPAKTSPAEATSPKRTKNVSIACFALYLASRLVGRNSAWRAVLLSE
jgi:hypothetical protein